MLRYSYQKEDEDTYKVKDEVMEYVKAVFKPEFLNRLDEIILFHRLNRNNIHDIVRYSLKA